MRRKKVKIKGTLSKEENKRIEKVLEKYGYNKHSPSLQYGKLSKTYLYE